MTLFAGIICQDWSRLKPLVMSFPEVWHGRGASVWVDTINTPIFFTSRHSLSSHRHGYPGGYPWVSHIFWWYPSIQLAIPYPPFWEFWDPVDLWYSVTEYWDITKGRRGNGMYSNYSVMVTTFLWHPCGSADWINQDTGVWSAVLWLKFYFSHSILAYNSQDIVAWFLWFQFLVG